MNGVDPDGRRGLAVGTSVTWTSPWGIGPVFSLSSGIVFDVSENGIVLGTFGSGFTGGGAGDHVSWTLDGTYIAKDIEAFAGKDVGMKAAAGGGVVGKFAGTSVLTAAPPPLKPMPNAQKNRYVYFVSLAHQ